MTKTTEKTVAEKRWAIANAQGRGRPVILPTGLYWTKKDALRDIAANGYMRGFIAIRVTLTYETPK